MKHALLLLAALLLAGALWLLQGDEDRQARPLEGSDNWLEGAERPDPGLRADGSPAAAGAAEAGPAAAPQPGPASTAGDGTLSLRGRVVDTRRRPVEGAHVTLRSAAATLATATSDAGGTYTMVLAGAVRVEGRRLLLLAHAEDGRSGAESSWVSVRGGPEHTLPTLVLETSCDLPMRVVRDGAGVLGARVAVVRRATGVPAPLAVADGDAEGRVRVGGLPPGELEVYASAPGHGRGLIKVHVPRADAAAEIEVALQAERRLQVSVVDARTGRAVPGAEVLIGDARTMPDPHGPGYLPALAPARTDRDGRVEVRGLGAQETLYVNVRAAGYAFAPWWSSKAQVAGPQQEQVRVAIARSRRVRFPIVEDRVPAPPDGVELRVVPVGSAAASEARELSGRVEGGYAVVEGLGPGARLGVLVAPSGSQASFQAPAQGEEGANVTFRAPRIVRVRVIEPDGTPVAGLDLGLMAGGRSAPVPPATTDAEGRALFRDVGAERATLHRRISSQPWGGPVLATLDLRTDRQEHEVIVQAALECLLTLRIDGEARLPASYALMAAGQRVDPAVVEEDPALGELHFHVRPPEAEGALRLELHAVGFLPEAVEVDTAAGGAIQETLNLRPGGRLIVRVEPPPDGEYDLRLERQAEAGDAWQPAVLPGDTAGPSRTAGTGTPIGAGRTVFGGLAPGRYRAVDRISRTASRAVELVAGATAPAEALLDLASAAWIEGRVLAPRGSDVALARVLVAGRDDPSSAWSGTRPDAEGRFRVRALRGMPLELRVTHPTLSPAVQGGRVRVGAAAGSVELRLEVGAELRFSVVGYEDAHTPDGRPWRAPLQVHLVPELGEEKTPLAVQPVATRGTFRVGGFEPGTYTLWVTLGNERAPFVRRGLVLGTTTLDLGTLQPPAGARVRLRVAGLAERPGASVWATVTHQGQPFYARHGRLERETGEVVVSGLGPGTFRLIVRASGFSAGAPGARVLLEQSLSLQGEGETTLDVRLP